MVNQRLGRAWGFARSVGNRDGTLGAVDYYSARYSKRVDWCDACIRLIM